MYYITGQNVQTFTVFQSLSVQCVLFHRIGLPKKICLRNLRNLLLRFWPFVVLSYIVDLDIFLKIACSLLSRVPNIGPKPFFQISPRPHQIKEYTTVPLPERLLDFSRGNLVNQLGAMLQKNLVNQTAAWSKIVHYLIYLHKNNFL